MPEILEYQMSQTRQKISFKKANVGLSIFVVNKFINKSAKVLLIPLADQTSLHPLSLTIK